MSVRQTWAVMFEPERYPPPPLTGASVAWRYALAITWYLAMLGVWLAAFQAQRTGFLFDEPIPSPEGDLGQLPPAWWIVLDAAAGLLSLAVIHLRRKHPLAVGLLVHALTLGAVSVGMVSVWVLISVASRRNLRDTLIVAGTAAAAGLGSFLLPWAGDYSWTNLAAGLGSSLLFVLLGMYLGVRRDRRAGFLRRVELAEQDRSFAVLAERNRIAREMHDVLAHRISLVSMHAGVLAYRSDLPPEKTQEIASIIQENAHASLTELRSVLSTLRATEAGVVAPQPTLADLPELLDDVRGSGQPLEVHDTLDASALPLVQQRHLYRIIQECLTNARKHAHGAPVDLALRGSRREGITVSVANAMTSAPAAAPGAGLGLVGITERAHMLGGRLEAGVRGGRFTVEAWLPWENDFRRNA